MRAGSRRIVLALERLNRVLQFDPLQWRMRVEAGLERMWTPRALELRDQVSARRLGFGRVP